MNSASPAPPPPAAALPTVAAAVETVDGELETCGTMLHAPEYAGWLDADRECEHEHLPTDRSRSPECLTARCFERADGPLLAAVVLPAAPQTLPRAA